MTEVTLDAKSQIDMFADLVHRDMLTKISKGEYSKANTITPESLATVPELPVNKHVTHGFDFDGTVSTMPEVFRAFMIALRQAGHKVYIVTMRFPSEECEGIKAFRDVVDGVIFTERQAKDLWCRTNGLLVNIWHEDNPLAINYAATAIWSNVTPEGTVHSPTHLE